jgi:hypothetical protein
MIRRKTIDPAKAELQRYYREEAGIKKPEGQQKTDEREGRQQSNRVMKIRQYVFARERDICRVTRCLPAESMHELRFRSLGGKVSRENSIAVQGDGVRGIHGFLQRNEITYTFEHPSLGAEGTITFTARSAAAADAMKVGLGESIVSPPLGELEREAS